MTTKPESSTATEPDDVRSWEAMPPIGREFDAETARLKSVYIWRNGMAMVFDRDGKQVPELQGRATSELISAIKARCDDETEWNADAVWGRLV